MTLRAESNGWQNGTNEWSARTSTPVHRSWSASGDGGVHFSAADRQLLEWLVRSGRSERIALRARIVLAAADGWSSCRIARMFGTSRPTVLLWRRRFAVGGIPVLLEEARRPGRPRRQGAVATCQALRKEREL